MQTLTLLGSFAARNGRLELAREIHDTILTEAAGRDVPLWGAHLALMEAEILGAQGQTAAAADRIQQVISEGATYPLHAHETLARMLAASGRADAAVAEYEFLIRQRGRALVECLGGGACMDLAANVLAAGKAERRWSDAESLLASASKPGGSTRSFDRL